VLGPWSGWQAACNSLNEEKYEASLMAIVLLSWSGWQTASNSLNEEKYGVSLLVTVSLSCTLELMANRLQFSQ
jgi:hypothetical protein